MVRKKHVTKKQTSHRIINYDRNDGRSGVVYILENRALREGLYKIGQSTVSGHRRASDLNLDATTGLPAEYVCIFEHKTLACGRAEKSVHQRLSKYRRGKWGQEFFEVPLAEAQSTIREECTRWDAIATAEAAEASRLRKIAQENVKLHPAPVSTERFQPSTPQAIAMPAPAPKDQLSASHYVITIIVILIGGYIYGANHEPCKNPASAAVGMLLFSVVLMFPFLLVLLVVAKIMKFFRDIASEATGDKPDHKEPD